MKYPFAKTLDQKPFLQRFIDRTAVLKIDTLALWFAYRDHRTPLYAKLFSIFIVGYAFSPIDIIPDFIPFLGYLDDAIIIPIGIIIAIKLIPKNVLNDSRMSAIKWLEDKKDNPQNKFVFILIILFWILFTLFLLYCSVKLCKQLF